MWGGWYCWWFRNLARKPPGMYPKSLWIMGFQLPFPQLVSESGISGCHQQHSTGVFPRIQVPGNPVAAIFGVHQPRNLSPWRKRCSVRTGCLPGETGMFYIVFWLVVSNLFMSPSIWGRWTHFDEHIFQMGWCKTTNQFWWRFLDENFILNGEVKEWSF